MCDPVTAVEDVALTAIGQPELIPVANAGTSLVEGKGLKGAAIAGGEALVGQEVGGAFGVGSGNTAVNDALGITWDNPTSLGLPDVGGAVNNALNGGGGNAGTFGFDASGNATTVAGDVTATGAPVGAAAQPLSGTDPVASSSSPSAGAGGTVSASNAGTFGSDKVNSQFAQSLTQGSNLTGVNAASPNLATLSGASADSALGAAGTDATGSYTPSGPVYGSEYAAQMAPNAAGPVPGSTPSGGAGGAEPQSFWGKAGDIAMKGALPAAGLAYTAIKGPASLPPQASNLASGGAATAPLLGLETQGATEASTGQLTAPQQANILQGVQQQQNALLQQIASSGSTDPTHDSRYIMGMEQIQQWALAQQQQYIQQAITEATSAGGAASQNIASVANEQIQQDAAYQQALAQAFSALGMSLGGGGINVNKAA